METRHLTHKGVAFVETMKREILSAGLSWGQVIEGHAQPKVVKIIDRSWPELREMTVARAVKQGLKTDRKAINRLLLGVLCTLAMTYEAEDEIRQLRN
jgi:hypothetical protein